MERPDIGDFEPGRFYIESHSEEVYEYIGTAQLNVETVAVFRHVAERWCLIATRRDYDNGQTFTPFGEAVEFDTAADA